MPTCATTMSASSVIAHRVEPAEADMSRLERFIADWDRHDRYDRFGSQNEAVTRWLIGRFRSGSQSGLVASAGREIIALLDVAQSGRVSEIGLFVARGCRRAGVGKTLLHRLIEQRGSRGPLVAECRHENQPATSFLAACGFSVVFADGGETRWVLCRRATGATTASRDPGTVLRLVGFGWESLP